MNLPILAEVTCLPRYPRLTKAGDDCLRFPTCRLREQHSLSLPQPAAVGRAIGQSHLRGTSAMSGEADQPGQRASISMGWVLTSPFC